MENNPQKNWFSFRRTGTTVAAVILVLLAVVVITLVTRPKQDEPAADSVTPTTKTYTSEKLGYSVTYPIDWAVDEESEWISPLNKEPNMVYFRVSLEDSSLEDMRRMLNKKVGGQDNIEAKINFAGTTAYEYKERYPQENALYYDVIVEHNGKVYSIMTQKYQMPEVKAIFRSFKFIDPDTVVCGGLAGTPCPEQGYKCAPEGSYPDAATICKKEQ